MLCFQWKPCIGCPIFPRFSPALCFHALFIGGGSVRVFLRNLLRVCFLCLFPALSTGDIFPSFPGPVPSTCFMFSCAFYRFHISFPRSLSIIRYFLKYVLIYVTFVTVLLTGIVFLFIVTRFQRQSKVTRWDVQQGFSFLFSFETSQVQTGTLGLSFLKLWFSFLLYNTFFIVDLQMALQKNGIDCGFVNIINKLPSHHVKGASIVLAVVVQELSRRRFWTLIRKVS